MNEVSNGTSGNQEYVEFIVVDATATYDCNVTTPPCIDIRGWIFDDNSGYHGAVGIAAGAVRFSFDPLWSCVPLGTIIVIYNDGDPNPAIPASDISMADGNCRIIAPISNTALFEKNSTTPGAMACSYPSTGWGAGGTWSNTLFANTGDCARIVNLAGCEVFSVCYATANTNNLIYFSSGGSGGQNVWYFNGGDPTQQVNWSEGSASPSPGNQTPGAPNNAANAAYISQFNNSCSPITPIVVNAVSTNAGCICDGTATASASGSIGGYTYTWYDSSFIPIGQTNANATGLCAGTYNVIATSSIGCSDTSQVIITNSGGAPNTAITPVGPFCQNSGPINLSAATSGGTWTGTGITNSSLGAFDPAIAGSGTFTITYSIGGPCPGSSITTITVNALTIPSFNLIAPICTGGTITLPTTSTNGITGTWSPAVNNTATTTYTFTPTAGQCATTTTMTVTVNPIPTVTVPANISACPGDNVPGSAYTSNPAGGTFDWTNSNSGIGLGANGVGSVPAFTATNGTGSAITGTITVTPTLNGCVGTPSTYTITVNDLLDPTITPAGPFCADAASVNLTAVDGGGTWSGTGITNAATGTFDPATAGAGTHIITYTIAGSCGGTDTENIIVNPIPVVNPIANIAACEGDQVAASAYSSTPAGATFTWTNSNTSIGLGAGATGNAPGFTATNGTGSAITGTISVTPTLNGCIGLPVTYTITINDQFDATITPVGPFCESDASIAMNAVDAGGSWTGNGITNGATGTFDPVTAGPGAHTIAYTIGGSCGDIQTTTITVNPDMDATISAAGPFCTNDPAIALTALNAGGVWSGTGITNTALGIFDPSIAGAGIHLVTYSISGPCGDSQSISIIVNDQLNAAIIPAGPFCESDAPFGLTAIDMGGVWTGNGITNGILGTFDPSIAGVGTHTITYTIGGLCGDSQTTIINVNPNADATILPAGPFCINDPSINLTALNVGGTWSGTGITSAVNGTFNPSVSGAGTFTITYNIAGTCGDSQTMNIMVTDQISSTINPVNSICENEFPIQLTATNSGGVWSGIGITNSTTGIFDPIVSGAGTFTITYAISGNCGSSSSIDITVNPNPVPLFISDIVSGCAPLTVNFTDNTGILGSNPIWTFGDGINSTSNESVSHTYLNSGQYTVSLTLTTPEGCIGTTTINNMIEVFSIPIADFIWSPEDISILNTEVQFTNTSIDATSYLWDFSGLGNSTLENPLFTFPSDLAGSYNICLVASNLVGCADTICQEIIIHDEFIVYVPNAFTPDGDNINDSFYPVVAGHDPEKFEFMIFNRWGELIFETTDDHSHWDGTFKGILSKEDVYVWKLSLKDGYSQKQYQYTGHVTLLK